MLPASAGPVPQHLSPRIWLHHHLPCHHHGPQRTAHRQAGLHSHHRAPQHCPIGAWQRAEVHCGLSATSRGGQGGGHLTPFSGPCSVLSPISTRCQRPLWRETGSRGQSPSGSRDSKGQRLSASWTKLAPDCALKLSVALWTPGLAHILGREVSFFLVTFLDTVQPFSLNKLGFIHQSPRWPFLSDTSGGVGGC